MDNLISEKSRKMDDSKVVNSSRNPRCAHCRNHGVQTTLKGHKAYCPYRNCNCGLCQLVRMRQKVMAKNVALRRRQELDKMKMHEILHSHKNDEPGTMRTLMSGERDGEKSNSEAESESPSSARNPEGNHISALALIILNFYNNDPKIAMDSIKKVASELSSLIQGDTVNSESGHNLQHGEGKHLNSSDLERISTTTPNEIFSPSAFTSSPKKVIFPATPSMYLSPFHPLALKTYRSTLAQGQLSTPLTRRSEQDQNGARAESKIDMKSPHVNESPFSIKSLTSELNNKSKSKPHQIEPSSHPILPFFGMAGHLRHVPAAFAFPQPQQPFACVPFPTFQALPTTMWAKNWCRRDHNTDVLPSHNQY